MPRAARLRGIAAVLVAAVVAAIPATGHAFWARRSPGNRLTMNLNVGTSQFDTVGYGRQSWNSLAEMALDRWNSTGIGATPDLAFYSVTSPGQPAPQCESDGINEVRFASTTCDSMSFGDILAITLVWIDVATERIVEADVMFNQSLSWSAYPGPLRRTDSGSPLQDFFRVALHEFGHAFGLGHPDDIAQSVAAIMNSRASDTDDLQADDMAGAHAIAWSPGSGLGPVLAASVLPASRSVRVGVAATAFATIINTAPAPASNCRIAPATTVPASFSFQTTDPATNRTTGTANAPATIPAANQQTFGQQSFVFGFTPTADFPPIDVALTFVCDNTDAALEIGGVNTLLLSASSTAIPDIVALAATLSSDGIVNVPGPAGTGVFSVATVNVGTSGPITASADTGSASLPLAVTLCETNPATGQCLSSIAASVTTQIDANATPTFGIFVRGSDVVAFDPATNRIFVRFRDAGGVIRGATSVAVRTQ